jgi:hypothetical protein
MEMSDIKNERLKKDIKEKMTPAEQKLVLGLLAEIEAKGSIDTEKAKKIGAKAFEEAE